MRNRSLIAGIAVGVSAVVTVAAVASIGADEENEGPAGDLVQDCDGAAAIDFACYEERFSGLVRSEGARAALKELAAEQDRNGYVRAACHQLTHRIGRAAGEIEGIDALGEGTPVCASGYYHGVLQGVMGELGPEQAGSQADTICEAIRSAERHSADHYNCAHGLGHGFMEIFSSDVFASLEGCESLAGGWEREKCSGGVFMENVTAIDDPGRPSTSLRPRQPLYPCTVIARRYKAQCYDWQITYAVYLTNGDFGAVFRLCEAQDRRSRTPCYRGLGGDALQQSKFVTARPARNETLRELCRLGPTRQARGGCISGAVRNMFRDYTDGPSQARRLCRTLAKAGDTELHRDCASAYAYARRSVPVPERDRT